MYPEQFQERETQIHRMGLLEQDYINIEFHIGNYHKRVPENEPAMLDKYGKPQNHIWTAFVNIADPKYKNYFELLVKKVTFYTDQDSYHLGVGFEKYPGSLKDPEKNSLSINNG